MGEYYAIDFLTEAMRLAELGYAVFPCVPGGKRPLTANGVHDATTDEFQIELWWQDNPDANLAVATNGLLIVDRDTDKETGKPNPWLADDYDKLTSLMAGPVASTPRGGDHSWFRQPAGRSCSNTVGKLATGVDTRADGGYVLVYPSIVDGKRYTWLETNPLESSPDKLPVPPEWLLDALDNRRPAIPIASETAEVGEGGRNAYLARTAGALRRSGLDESEILAALQVRNETKCKPPLDADEVRLIAWSVSRYEANQIATMIVEGSDPEPSTEDPGPFPSRLLEVPGFIHRVMDWNLRGAIRPQPELALAGALALLGTITGRKVEGETQLRTNLYSIGLCDTGGGKDRSLQVNKKLLLAANAVRYMPMEDVASAAGIVNVMKSQPCILVQIDEVGKFLKATRDAKANPHLAEVVTVLMKFFSSANSFYAGKGYADTEKKSSIINPHACVYGVSVAQSVMESLTTENLTDGFVSRLLIFEASDNNPMARRYIDTSPPPQEAIDEIAWWDHYQPGGNLSGVSGPPVPRVVRDGAGVNDMFFEAEEWYRAQRETGEPGSALWTRAAEKARKLALLYQLSADRESVELSQDAARWALDVVLHLTKRMIYLAKDWVSDSKTGADKNKLVRRLRERGPQSISQLLRHVQHLRSKEVQELLQDLMASGQVLQTEEKSGGRPRITYQAV